MFGTGRKDLIADNLANFICDFSFDDIPTDVLEHVKKCVMDSVACMLGGIRTEVGATTLEFVESVGGNPQSSVIGTSHKTSSILASFANSTTANALDFDDTYMGHPGATIIPPALSFAEAHHCSGRDFLTSVVAGYEISIRIGKAIHPSATRFKEVKGIATWQIFGAVSAVGKLLRLNAKEMANALGVAAAYAPVPAVIKIGSHDPFPMTMVKNPFGMCSMSGGVAAMLAKKGYTGPTDVFDGNNGFWKIASSDRCDFDMFTKELGKNFEALNVAFKPYSCCRYIHAALDACLGIQEEHDVNPRDIKSIRVKSLSRLKEWKKFDINAPPANMLAAQFCPSYIIAVALSGITPGPEWFTPERLRDRNILGLANKIRLVADPEADRISHEEFRLTATAIMETTKGNYTYSVKSAKGERDNPVTQSWIENKFRNLASGILNKSEANRAISAIRDIEEITNLRQLVKEFCALAK